MGLFFEVLQAINNPNQQASTGELSNVINSVEELANRQGIDPSTMPSVMSALGDVLRPALKQQQVASGAPDLGNLVGQLTSGGMGGTALSSLLSPAMQQRMIEAVSQKTGLTAGSLQGMLPALLPSVLSLLKMGETQPGVPGGNPLLNSFLDSDRDGDVDLGDIYQFARRFLNR